MKIAINFIQIILSLILITLIFLQSQGEGDGRSNILSPVVFEKRGWEKIVFSFTIFILAAFLITSVIQTFIYD